MKRIAILTALLTVCVLATANDGDNDVSRPLNRTCEPDITPVPVQNALSVPVNVSVSALFSENMDAGTMDSTSYVIQGRSSGPHFGTITSSSTLVSMDPDDAFAPGEIVTATVTSLIECDNGESLQDGYTWQFTTDVTPSQGSFAAATLFGTGGWPYSVFAADLDGYGDLDLVTANSGSNDVSVLLNNGDGSFAAATPFSAGNGANSVFAADLDGDGDLDLATANENSDDVSVLLNENLPCEPDITPVPDQNALSVPVNVSVSATFSENMDAGTMDSASYVIHGLSSGPHYGTITSSGTLVSMDPDDDFAPGEVVTATLTNTVECDNGEPLLNGYTWQFTCAVDPNSPGVFGDPSHYQSNINEHGPIPVSAADLDGDGDIDLVTANPDGNDVSVLRNYGDGTFAAPESFGTGEYPYSVFAADLDSDGDLDLATANYLSNDVSVLLNNGTGTFGYHTTFSTGENPSGVYAADLDGDGDLDLVTSNHSSWDVSVLLNNGDGSFAAAVPFSTGDRSLSVFAADLDGDGDLDLVTANYGDNNVSVLLNNGDGSFAAATPFSVGNNPYSVFAADLDSDGDLDLAVANLNGNTVSILLNTGNGTFGNHTAFGTGDGPCGVLASDLDGDGDLDLITANSASNDVSILLNNGDGSFTVATNISAGNMPVSVLSADLDGDMDLDIVTANFVGNDVSVLLNEGLSCCMQPIRGNVDYDPADQIDISDLVYLVDYMFNQGPEPPCWEEANVDGSGPATPPDEGSDDIDISDLVHLVDYMFTGGPPPADCP
jgi:hypothetical protein